MSQLLFKTEISSLPISTDMYCGRWPKWKWKWKCLSSLVASIAVV